MITLDHDPAPTLDRDALAARQLDLVGLVTDDLAGLDHDLGCAELCELPNIDEMLLAIRFEHVAPDLSMVTSGDGRILRPVTPLAEIAPNERVVAVFGIVLAPDHHLAIAPARLVQRPPHAQVHASLRMHEDLLTALRIFDPQLVEALAAGRRAA